MKSLKQTLIDRDNLSPIEADEAIKEAQAELFGLLDEGQHDEAYNICQTYFDLEPDYIDEIMSA